MDLFGRKKDVLDEETRKKNKEVKKFIEQSQKFSAIGSEYNAIKYIDEALKLDSKHPFAWLLKGNLLKRLKKYDEAISCFDKVIQLEPNDISARMSKGDALKELRKYEEAISCFDEVIRLEPNNTMAFTAKSILLDKLTDLKNKKPIERKGWSESEKEQIRIDQDGKCALCQKPPPRWEYDHIDGNRSNDSVSNCQGLCPNCHSIKTHED